MNDEHAALASASLKSCRLLGLGLPYVVVGTTDVSVEVVVATYVGTGTVSIEFVSVLVTETAVVKVVLYTVVVEVAVIIGEVTV